MSRVNRFIPLSLGLALIACTSAASAATVGYYEICAEQGLPEQAAAITTAGHTPVNVAIPDAASLAGLDMLFVTNCNNGGSGAEYDANFTAISNAVAGGMTLMVHDRWVTGGGSLVPGSAGITFARDFNDDSAIDIPAGSPILSGPGGILDNTSLDGGGSSSHGFVAAASLPAGGQVIAHRTNPTEAVTVAYGHGAGVVVYSTIPLDYYLDGATPAAFASIYAPNVIAAYAGDTFTTCAAEGLKGDPLKLCRLICESNLQAGTLVPLIRLWVIKMRTDPPCATMAPL